MSEKCDLARMLHEISEEAAVKDEAKRAMTQDEIKRLMAQKKKQPDAQQSGGAGSP